MLCRSCDERGEAFSLLAPLARLRDAGEVAEWPVWVRYGEQRIAGRVCAIRKSREAIAQAQRRLKLKQQNGKSVGPETQFYAEYVLVFTSLASETASAHQVLDAYRLRWQVELTFKRLKSIAQIGHVPKQDEKSSRAWLYGKLLVALLSQKLARVGKAISPWGYYIAESTHPQPVA